MKAGQASRLPSERVSASKKIKKIFGAAGETPALLQQLFRNLDGVERCAVGQILKIMDAAKTTTVKSVSVFTKETARRVLKLI